MGTLTQLIAQSVDETTSLAERQEAFGKIIRRYQDMVFGCAYAGLGDYHLAEDAAQEAFLVAWQELPRLRHPDAFGGWLRRIVASRCHRLQRYRKPELPLEEELLAPDTDPHCCAEQAELQRTVRQAVERLPELERLVVVLFYINEFSQREVAAFLGVPVTTVNKRLHTARQRLRERTLAMFQEDLQEQRPSRSDRFASRAQAHLRPFREGDWRVLPRIVEAVSPGCEGNEEWLDLRRAFDEGRFARRHYTVENPESGETVAYGSIEQQGPETDRFRVYVVCPENRLEDAGAALYERLDRDLRELGATTAWVREYASESALADFFTARGYQETGRVQELRLDLSEAEPPVSTCPEVTFATLAEERQRNPQALDALHALHVELMEAQGMRPDSRATLAERLAGSSILPEGYFIAIRSGHYIGVGILRRDMAARPDLWSQTVDRLGGEPEDVSVALAARTMTYAKTSGCTALRAFAGRIDSPRGRFYTRLGFRPHREMVILEKRLHPEG